MRHTLSILLAAGLAVAAPAIANGPPPRDLNLVGDHWTAWEPPTAFPEGAQVHVVERGDTLWALAARFYGDPYLWPQLWEQNQYVRDAHWIYPGDPLLVGVQVVTPEELSTVAETGEGDGGGETGENEGTSAGPDDGLGLLNLDTALRPPSQLGSASDLYCSGFLSSDEAEFAHQIIGNEYDALAPQLAGGLEWLGGGVYGAIDAMKFGLSTGDIVYVDGGAESGLEPGQLFTAVQAGERVRHPRTGEFVGRYYGELGRIRILSVQEKTAIAEITADTCAPVLNGSKLMPFEEEPVPLGRVGNSRPANLPSPIETLEDAPVIVYGHEGAISLAAEHVVFIDRGEEDDVVPGDLFTIYRRNRKGMPPVVLGELAVLSVRRNVSVAKILESRFPIYVGDLLELK